MRWGPPPDPSHPWRGPWRWAHTLSLDVALGAVALSGAVARAWGAPQGPAVALALAMAILLIYSLDHLLDLHSATRSTPSPRRRAHHRARPALRATALSSALIGLALLPALPRPLLALGLSLGALCALYLAWAQRLGPRRALKPWLVTLGYSVGVSLAGVSGRAWGAPSPLPPLWVGLAASALAALCAALNVLLLSRHEAGGARALPLGGRVASAALVGAVGALSCPARSLLSPLALPLLALACLWWAPRWAAQRDRYRLLGDGALSLAWTYLA